MRPCASNPVQKIFSTVPATYELINHLLTFGLDILWRKRAARTALNFPGRIWADFCTGTGETAAYLARLAPAETRVFAVDFTLPMLAQGKAKPEAPRIAFIQSDIRSLPFPDNSLDLITMSFAARNINVNRELFVRSLVEYCRVLKPGGAFVNLETSQPVWLIRKLRNLYVKLFVELVGAGVSGSKPAYAYLAHTIPRFYSSPELSGIFHEAGFKTVSAKRLLFGVAAIHMGKKG